MNFFASSSVKSLSSEPMVEEDLQWMQLRLHLPVISQASHLGSNTFSLRALA